MNVARFADLPPGIDPCGELGEAVMRDGFAFQDLIPARAPVYAQLTHPARWQGPIASMQ